VKLFGDQNKPRDASNVLFICHYPFCFPEMFSTKWELNSIYLFFLGDCEIHIYDTDLSSV
jgi:hypothetical protein